MNALERKVVDAARAWQHDRKKNPPDPRSVSVLDSDLGYAVDALDTAEKSGPRFVRELSVRARTALQRVIVGVKVCREGEITPGANTSSATPKRCAIRTKRTARGGVKCSGASR